MSWALPIRLRAVVHRSELAYPLIQEAWDRRRRRRRRWAGTIAVVAIASGIATYYARGSSTPAACSTASCDSATAATTRLPNPCTLLTNAEVAPELGAGVARRIEQISATRTDGSCTWYSRPTGYSGGPATLILAVSRVSKSAFVKANDRAMRPTLPGNLREMPVVGLGVIAYRSGNGYEFNAWSHGYAVSVNSAYTAVYPHVAERLILKALHRVSS